MVELDFEMAAGSLNGIFTTVEGLFDIIIKNLKNENHIANDMN